jgi:hypothetical protein
MGTVGKIVLFIVKVVALVVLALFFVLSLATGSNK